MNHQQRVLCPLAAVLISGFAAQAGVINFEDRTGPSVFSSAGSAQTLNYSIGGTSVTFTGGVILTNTANLPADQTSIYGTANFASATLTNPLTVTFSSPISNFFLDVFNGQTTTASYTVSDNVGNTNTFSLAPNLNGGTSQIGFAATGTVVTIRSITGSSWDFFIDNVHFNEALPPALGGVPEPGTLAMLAGGAVLLIGMARRRLSNRAS